MAKPLAGCSVLVTRPQAQADGLCRRLEALGAAPVRLPTLLIGPVAASPALDAAIADVAVADWIIFASRNAVSYGFELLDERGLRLNPQARLATVGTGTAHELRKHGYRVTCKPKAGFNTEALLDMPEFAVGMGDRVLIFRGRGGRALMGDTLKERGARVRFVEVYQRLQPDLDVRAALMAWRACERRWTIVTSEEGLGNLLRMVGDAADELRSYGLVTVSERLIAAARRRGWSGPIRLAASPGDNGLTDALLNEND
ncbi:uroporphyrinogen-III synthase [Alkalilimnicola ehrlichii]|uniref:uroporphyrinogen-III synthase n=1 Tax=Alkalilimnicola ehrlichii TaxID=351052 RepID=UPI0015F29188|nr:uroporphyrinogen-III synthase [Alkalilimnicola ehrlichii]